MKKKLLYTILLVSLLSLSTACGKSKSDTKDAFTTDAAMEPTAVVTNSPLPTAEVKETTNDDGTVAFENTTDGYHVNYNKDILEVTNANNTIAFLLPDTDEESAENPDNTKTTSSVNPNVFLTITSQSDIDVETYKKELKKAYGKKAIVEDASLGVDISDAYLFTFKNEKNIQHEIYLAEYNNKVWIIELKYPKKNKKYKKAIVSVLESLQFNSEE